MEKDFDAWNKEKKVIHSQKDYAPFYKEREVRWCRLGLNIGFEQDGTGDDHSRPVVVLKSFNRHVCLVVPLTASKKENPFRLSVGKVGDYSAHVIISQLRLVDTRRLDKKITTLDKEIFEKIRKAVKDML